MCEICYLSAGILCFYLQECLLILIAISNVENINHQNNRAKLDCRHCLLPYAGTTGTRTGGAVAPNPSLDESIYFQLICAVRMIPVVSFLAPERGYVVPVVPNLAPEEGFWYQWYHFKHVNWYQWCQNG